MDGSQMIEAIRVFVALVTVAALVGLVVRRLNVPFSVGLLVVGLVAAAVLPNVELHVTPEVVLLVLVPGLVFEASYQLRLDELRRTFGWIVLLAAPGVLIAAGVVAVVLNLATGLPLELGFVVGAIVAATDPVAVVATFRRIGAPRRLATLVEGESLFNDGTGLVVFTIAVGAVARPIGAPEAVATFLATVVISAAIGALAGYLASGLVATVDDHLIELTISLALAYGTYLVADALHQSGVIATVVAGIVLGETGRRAGMSARTLEALDTVWEWVAYLLTALAFLLIGLTIDLGALAGAAPSIAWGIVAILVGRALVTWGLLGGASRVAAPATGGPIPSAWLTVLFWAGLRGAVATAMALSLPADLPQRELLQAIAFGIVVFTLLVQGATIDLLVHRLRLAPDPAGSAEPSA